MLTALAKAALRDEISNDYYISWGNARKALGSIVKIKRKDQTKTLHELARKRLIIRLQRNFILIHGNKYSFLREREGERFS